MGAVGTRHEDGSPFARAARELTALGYHVVPIIPPGVAHSAAGKAPGKFAAGEWRGLAEWERFRDRAPTEFELTLWSANYPDANIGIVCGSPAGDGLGVMAVDIDTNDFEEIDILLGALPPAIMSKKGAKGQTLFYRAPPEIKSKSYDLGVRPHARRVVDLLTGSQTRQTVAPPSNHTSGAVYRWLGGPVPAHELTAFDEAALEKLEDTLASLGWNPEAQRPLRAANPSRGAFDPDDLWGETKSAALARLVDWAPHLGLYNLRRARAGFEAVATWRESSTGRPLDERKRNLSIQPTGIKDFGTGETFSALDLVMRARGCDLEAATIWLRARLGFDDTPVMLAQPLAPRPVETMDPETGEIVTLPGIAPVAALPQVVAAKVDGEMPLRLTRTTGLLGEITQWILDTSRRPIPALALGAALTVMAVSAGRNYAGPTNTCPNLYTLLFAPSGGGKDHFRKVANSLLVRADMKNRVSGSFRSSASMWSRIKRNPETLYVIDESGSLFAAIMNKNATSFERTIMGVVRTVHGANFSLVHEDDTLGAPSEGVLAPAMSMMGISTQEEFCDAMTSGAVKNGVLNRCLMFLTHTQAAPVDPIKSLSAGPPDEVVRDLKNISKQILGERAPGRLNGSGDFHEPAVRVPWASPEAAKVYSDFEAWVDGIADKYKKNFYARAPEHAQRIATLKAIGDDWKNPVVRKEDLEWAVSVVLHVVDTMMVVVEDYVSDNQAEADVKIVLRAIKEHGKIDRGTLWRKLRSIKPRDRTEIIKALIEEGSVAELPEATGGRPRFVYVYTGD